MTPYYDGGDVVLYHGDCLDVLAELPDRAHGLLVTDPPYGVGVRYGHRYDDRRPDYWEWLRDVVAECRRVADVVAMTHRVEALRRLDPTWDWVGVWNKPYSGGARLGNSPLVPHWEPILLWGIHSLGVRTGGRADVFTVPTAPVEGARRRLDSRRRLFGRAAWEAAGPDDAHPTPKPERLVAELIDTLRGASDTVVDPFAGTGTTLVAARRLGIRAVGVEIEEPHCADIAARLAQGVLA